MITILHISDLHRDPEGYISTSALLESLRRDRDHYLEEGISFPDLAIVSGDLVLGAKGSDNAARAELDRQYEEAADFLRQLAELMFSGNRDRIVIVPGNHDVSHSHVLEATVCEQIPTEPDKRKIMARQLVAEGSLYRWVASDFTIRRIHDIEAYRRRMEPFANFYHRFYEGHREYSLNEEKQFALHDFPDLGIAVVGLSSCCDNDLFNRSGRVHPACVAEATRLIADPLRKGRIAIAAWHHNLSGGPKDSDYVDPEFLQSLIDGGFTVGLHGHQHRAQLLEHKFTADSQRGMTVISAGTLCGGPRTLPPGRMRGYNIITLDRSAKKGTVHVREMKNAGFGSPVWGAAYVSEFCGSSLTFDIKIKSVTNSSMHIASDAFQLLQKGDAIRAFELASSCPSDAFARRVAIEALTQQSNWRGIKAFCSPPQSNVEIILLINALDELGDKIELEKLIYSEQVAQSSDLAVRQIADQMRLHLKRF